MKKLRIAFDASCLVTDQKSGLAYYTQNIIQQLADAHPNDVELVGHYCNFLGRNKNLSLPVGPNISYKQSRLFPAKALNMLRRMHVWVPFEFLVKQRADFHFFPAFIGWPSLFHTRSSAVIHDLTYLDFPQYVSARARHDLTTFVPKTIKRAAFVTTISQTSALAIRQAYGGSIDIFVTHIPPLSARELDQEEAGRMIKQLDIQQSFILFLGNLEPRKNLEALLDAYVELESDLRQQYALVIAGGDGWNNAELLKRIESLQRAGHVIIKTGYVTDEQRAALLDQAATLVMPSHYEGFGMPILEAMSYRTPVIASDIPVFHEIGGDAILTFSPDKTDELAAQLKKVLTNEALSQKLVEAGLKNLQRFDWQDIVKRMYEQIRKVV